MIQVYGRFDGYWSHAQVSRGLVYGLYMNGLLDIQVCNVSRQGGYEGLSEPVEKGGYGISVPSGLAAAPIGIFIGGYPPQMSNWLEDHHVKVAMFITESAIIPKDWGRMANTCDLVLVPSVWVRNAYERAGTEKKKLMVVPHGIHPLYMYAEAQDPAPVPRLLHVCGSASFPQRKGTPQLVRAWREAFPDGEVELWIRMMPGGHEVEDEVARGSRGITVDHDPTALRPGQMIALQCGGGFSGVIQPSRAEAFGIVPVEARAVGLPVICTHCTGHVEHANPSDIVIDHRLDSHIQTNGIPNGAAPTVEVGDIVNALRRWHKAPPGRNRLSDYAQKWQWNEVTRKLASRLRQILSGFNGPRSLDVI